MKRTSGTRKRTVRGALGAAVLACLLASLSTGCGRDGSNPGVQPKPSPDAGVDAGVEPPPEPEPEAPPPEDGEEEAPVELRIQEVLPAKAPTSGGSQTLIKGQGFLEGISDSVSDARDKTTVKFGANPSLDVQIIDDTTMDVRVPPGTAGISSITVENPNGTAVCSGCFSYFQELAVTSVTPAAASISGGSQVTVAGQGFVAGVQVLFGGLSSPSVEIVSPSELRAVVPRGAASGAVDLTVYNPNGVGVLRRGFRYVERLAAQALLPATGALAGGTTVTLTGEGFEAGATSVTVGGVAAMGVAVQSATALTFITPAGVAGPADVVVSNGFETRTARGAFTYVTGTGAALYGVFPRFGPRPGGNVVTLTGEGLDEPGLTVEIGGVGASFSLLSPNALAVTVPAQGLGTSPRVDVTVTRASTGLQTLSGAYTYQLALTGVSPADGPTAGGTLLALTGENLLAPSELEVWVGGLQASDVSSPAEGQLAATAPPGASGAPSDVIVREAANPENEAVLPAAFRYDAPLTVGRLHPDRGAIAGGTLITVYGTGFGEGTVVDFGSERAKDVKVLDAHRLTCRAPRSNVGTVSVKVRRGGVAHTLPGAFSFFDPRNSNGGVTGGPLAGTLNVTVLDVGSTFPGEPAPLVNVMLGNDPSTPFQGLTDSRGQLTFSDPLLVGAPLLTVWKQGYDLTTISAVGSENVTVFIRRTSGETSPSFPTGGGGGSGGAVQPSLISGRVLGFKAPRPLGPDETLEARVFLAQTSIYSGPPYGGLPLRSGQTWQITQDGGRYLLATVAGVRAVYAVMGVVNHASGTFTPHLMGVRRRIAVTPDRPAENQDIVLDMHLDRTVPIHIDTPALIAGMPAQSAVYAWMDLGVEGLIPNPANWNSGTGTGTSVNGHGPLAFPYFPALDGSNFIFLCLSPGLSQESQSVFYRRQPGDLTQGLTLGPLLGPPTLLEPTESTGFTGTLRWQPGSGPVPDLQRIVVHRLSPFSGGVPVWSIVVPGTETQVTLPAAAVEMLLSQDGGGGEFYVSISTSRTPKFSYNRWTYDVFNQSGWTSFSLTRTQNFAP